VRVDVCEVHRDDAPQTDTLPLLDWERELGGLLAIRFGDRAKAALGAGEWDLDDLEDALPGAERRLTPPQRRALWEALTTDPELAQLASSLS
jgi:hypothetical protein